MSKGLTVIRAAQLQPQPPPAPPSPPMAASRTWLTWLWKSLPSCGFRSIAGSLSIARCHGCTMAQLVHRIGTKINKMTEGCLCMRTSKQPALSPVRTALQALVWVAASGCVGTGAGVPAPPEPGSVGPKTWAEIQTQIFEPTCAQPCHHGGASPKGLSLDTNSAHKMLVGVTSTELPAMLRVAPGKPDDSYLIVKLTSADPRRVGARMPRTGPPYLSGVQITALRHWILAGATQAWKDQPADAEVNTVPMPDAGGEVPDAGSAPDQAGSSETDAMQPSDLGSEN